MSYRSELLETLPRGGRSLLFGAAVLLFGACASTGGGPVAAHEAMPGSAPADADAAEFVITNQYPGPVNVYASAGALRLRLGTLTTWRTLRTSVPRDLVGRGRVVRLIAAPIGDRREVATEEFAIEAGDRVSWTIMQAIEGSRASLRVGF